MLADRLTTAERIALATFAVIAALALTCGLFLVTHLPHRPTAAETYVADLRADGLTVPTVAEVNGSVGAICQVFTSGQPVPANGRDRVTDGMIAAALVDSRLCGARAVLVPPIAAGGTR